MSLSAMTWVFDHSPYTLGARLVHLALADHANDDYGHFVWASQSRIAAKAKVSRTTVNAILQKMVREGWLDEVDSEESDLIPSEIKRETRAKVYRFRFEQRETCSESDTPMCRVDEGGCVDLSDAMCRVDEIAPITNSKNSSSNSRDVTSPQLSVVPEHPLTGFEEFWSIYPKRSGKRLGRGKAVERWTKLTLDERRAAWRGARFYAQSCDAGQQIAKDAFRWLRDHEWVDWQDPAEPTTVRRSGSDVGHELLSSKIRERAAAR